jgi:hypothetical protein
MTIPRWAPKRATTENEERLLKRLQRTKKLFAFLRLNRAELFDDAFQDELATMYRKSGEGKQPVPPALLAMATLLQAYSGVSDAEAVELTVVDARWQLVLDRLGATRPAFSQGALQAFRQRLIAHDLDQRLLERTAELAKASGGFDHKKLPKSLRLAVDSRPLEGAGRVEDTFNLLAHAARNLLVDAARITEQTPEILATEIGATSFSAKSIKRGLDVDWSEPTARNKALQRLLLEIAAIELWVRAELADDVEQPPLAEHLETLRRLRGQDLEPDPGGGSRIKDGVAAERQVSVSDPDMRHGRKSKSKSFEGYKSHVAVDIDDGVIVACAVTAANRPEGEAMVAIKADLGDTAVAEWHIDRGYISAPEIRAASQLSRIVCRPWRQHRAGKMGKNVFRFDFRRKILTCPTGATTRFELGTTALFDAATCNQCSVRRFCTSSNNGRSINVLADEPLQHELRAAIVTPEGRQRLRQRTTVEHRLAHHAQKQGTRARYIGLRNNLFDARRHAAVLNLEAAQLKNAA